MKIDYAKTIQYIKENFDDLAFTNQDWKKLNDLLEFLKKEIEMEVISEVILGDESVGTQIQEARKRLGDRRDFLAKQKSVLEGQTQYKEFVPRENVEGVAPAVQASVENTERKRYEKEKHSWEENEKTKIESEIKALDEAIARIDSCAESLKEPEIFVREFIGRNLEQEIAKQEFQKLVNHCATTMAYGYMEMEYMPGVGALFTKQNGVTSNFEGYEINPDAVKKFLGLVRDTELLDEVVQYYDIYSDYCNAQREFQMVQQEKEGSEEELSKKMAMRNALQDENNVAELEELITTIVSRVASSQQLEEELTKLELPVPTGFFAKLLAKIKSRFFPDTTIDEQRAELVGKKSQNTYEITQALSTIISRSKEDENFAQLYNMYRKVGRDIMGDSGYTITRNFGSEVANLVFLADERLPSSMHEVVEYKLKLDEESLKELDELIKAKGQKAEELTSQIENKKKFAMAAFERLSPEAQSYHTVKEGEPPASIGPARYWKDKYVDVSNPEKFERYYSTPFVSSLIMETLIKVGEERKIDLAEAFKISPETIAQYRSRGTQLAADLKDFLDSNSKKIGAKLETKYSAAANGQDIDEERED